MSLCLEPFRFRFDCFRRQVWLSTEEYLKDALGSVVTDIEDMAINLLNFVSEQVGYCLHTYIHVTDMIFPPKISTKNNYLNSLREINLIYRYLAKSFRPPTAHPLLQSLINPVNNRLMQWRK